VCVAVAIGINALDVDDSAGRAAAVLKVRRTLHRFDAELVLGP
jgi:hypothetical protein